MASFLASFSLLCAGSSRAVDIPAGIAGDPGTGQNRGFLVRSAQAPDLTEIPNSATRARQQLNGTLRDAGGDLVEDQAEQGENPDGSFDVDVINFERDANPDVSDATNFPDDVEFPGIPGTDGHTSLFTTEIIAFLDLSAGEHTIGAQVFIGRVDTVPSNDNGLAIFAGTNPRDFFATEIATYVRSGDSPSFSSTPWDDEFSITAPVAGIYPVRVVYWAQAGGAALELYEGDELINSENSSIVAYRESTTPEHSHAYVAEVSPPPGVSDISTSEPIDVVLIDDKTTVMEDTVVLSFNGADVTSQANVEKNGNVTSISYQPPGGRQSDRNELVLEYLDSAGQLFTNEWSFKNALGEKPPKVTGQWDFSGGLDATFGADLQYADGPNGTTAGGTEFGTTTDFGIPDIDGSPAEVISVPDDAGNDVGYLMDHGIAPNGGGSFVNRYTLLMDVIKVGGGGASAIIQMSPNKNPSDATYFWQRSNMGQGGGGYVGDGSFTSDEWHRIGFAVDLTGDDPLITKWVDGILQDEWTVGMSLDHKRRAMEPEVILFADGDERSPWYVNSVQILDGKLSDEEMEALGGPTAEGFEGPTGTGFQISELEIAENGDVTISWESRPGRSYTIEASDDLQKIWLELTDGHPSQGDSTSFTEESGDFGDAAARYYRVIEEG